MCEICACRTIPRARVWQTVPIWYPLHQRRNCLPQTLAPINTFHTSPIAVPQISCDVTHHSGVFTADYASEGDSSHSLPFFLTHVWMFRGKSYSLSVAWLQHRVSQVTTFSNRLFCEHKQPSRDAGSKSSRAEGKIKTPQRSPVLHTQTSITLHLQSLVGLLL